MCQGVNPALRRIDRFARIHALDVDVMRLQHGGEVCLHLGVLNPRNQRPESAHHPCLATVQKAQALLQVGNRHGLAPERPGRAGRRALQNVDRAHQHAAPAHLVLVNVLHQ
jgi:hypothetical protein